MNGAIQQKKHKGSKLFSDEEFLNLTNLFINLTSNKFSSDKRTLLESRLLKRLNETNLTPAEYITFLNNNNEEKEQFISALTTHKTDWFREPIHIDFTINEIKRLYKNKPNEQILIWSAACSTGEELYSICMRMYQEQFTQFKILGTDISQQCLQNGNAGLYSEHQVENQVPDYLRKIYFKKLSTSSLKQNSENSNNTKDDGKSVYQISNQFKKHIKWRQYNLLESNLSGNVLFDFIYLRNVLIYFDQKTLHQAIKRTLRYLKPGGFIIIGLSENITFYGELDLKRVGNSIYRYEP